MIFGIGTDIVRVARMEKNLERFGDRFARRLLTENELRDYVRNILDVCMPGGRYLLGSGNSVCNYIPVDNYFAMMDEGFKYFTG